MMRSRKNSQRAFCVEHPERDGIGPGFFREQQPRDQKAAEHEKQVDADESRSDVMTDFPDMFRDARTGDIGHARWQHVGNDQCGRCSGTCI